MVDDKGLDLSLGLPCGGSSSNAKERSGNSADTRSDPDERTSKIVNEFKNFLSAGLPQPHQRSDPVKLQDNFLYNLPQTASGGNACGKRKSTFNDMNAQKKQQPEAGSPELVDKGKTSHISITSDEEGSTADNEEDVAESEAEGSSSRTVSVSHCEDRSSTPGSSSRVHQARPNVGTPVPVNTLGSPYSLATIKESSSVGLSSTSRYPRGSMMQSAQRPLLHITAPGNVPMTIGYSSVRPPMTQNDTPRGIIASPQSLHSPYMQRVIPASGPNMCPSEVGKGLAGEVGCSSLMEKHEVKRQANSFPVEYPSIRPGLAADVTFGGSGSFPNLPWVSTTGPGPNGRTISGVTYKYNATQVKVVCACHGTHMSPDEFIRHANAAQDHSKSDTVVTPTLTSLPNGNPAASAQT